MKHVHGFDADHPTCLQCQRERAEEAERARDEIRRLYDEACKKFEEQRSRALTAESELAELRERVDRLTETMRGIHTWTRLREGENHRRYGEACGEDVCMICLIESTAEGVLQNGAERSPNPESSARERVGDG